MPKKSECRTLRIENCTLLCMEDLINISSCLLIVIHKYLLIIRVTFFDSRVILEVKIENSIIFILQKYEFWLVFQECCCNIITLEKLFPRIIVTKSIFCGFTFWFQFGNYSSKIITWFSFKLKFNYWFIIKCRKCYLNPL